MKYSIEQLEADIKKQEKELALIRADRGKRYGREKDTLANLRNSGGFRSAAVHAQECLNRIINNCWKPIEQVDPMEINNASDDLVNYAHYIQILFNQELKE